MSGALERARTLDLSQQASRAISQLWAAGNLALTFRVVSEDFERLVATLRSSPPAEVDLSTFERLEQELAELGRPELDSELTALHVELLERVEEARRSCLRLLRCDRTRSRRKYVLSGVLALLLLGVVALAFWPRAPRVSASHHYSHEYTPDKAIDGLQRTEWLLPDGRTGWLELEFRRARSITGVRVRNSENRYFRDRAARAFVIEAFANGKPVASASGEFAPIESNQPSRYVPLKASGVTRVRITISSFYGLGAGLAEIDVE